jgi:hypothetical protein
MKPDDVYEQWKQQASSVEAPSGFEAKVMAGVSQSDVEPTLTRSSARLLDHPAWATAAVLAASLVGLFRVAFALLIGIW